MKTNQIVFAALFALVASIAIPQAFAMGNDEWLDIDMQLTASSGDLTATCEKNSDVEFNMVMTFVDHERTEILYTTGGSSDVISGTITMPDSLVKVFCEYTNDSGDRVGYAIMRTYS